ncbi:MAG: U32 family peptidase [Candidatus Margulisiibacteriota bacterium]
MKKPELLAPAGTYENATTAFLYGADAIYQGWEGFSLRTGKKAEANFECIKKSLKLAREKHKKYYLALNIFARNDDIDRVKMELSFLDTINADAFIISDPGIMTIIKDRRPDVPIHLSTQANTLNYESVRFWKKLGISRIILARELHHDEINRIRVENPEVELEVFIHGAMCMAYAGRCNMSQHYAGREANAGDCAHVCRWKFDLIKDGQSHEMELEDAEGGTYILNSTDLCMAPYIKDLMALGIESFKVEGRNKTSYYVANVIRVYRHLIDEAYRLGEGYQLDQETVAELNKVSHRRYSAGFFKEGETLFNVKDSKYLREYKMVAVVKSCDAGVLVLQVRDKIETGEAIEIIYPEIKRDVKIIIPQMTNEKTMEKIVSAHNGYEVSIPWLDGTPIPAGLMVRMAISEK